MKKILLTMLLVSGVNLVSKFSASSSMTLSGAVSLENQTYDKLNINGAANLEEISALSVHVSGALCAKRSDFKDAFISGAANLEHCTVVEKLSVSGSCNVEHSNLCDASVSGGLCLESSKATGKIIVTGRAHCADSNINEFVSNGKETVFKNCHVSGSIKIEESQEGWFWSFFNSKDQMVKLTDTIVQGDVIFEKEGGRIVCKGLSKIHGKIVNGAIV